MQTFQLGKKKIGPGHPVFIVAEVANAHNGNLETAHKMIDVIKDAGVDAIKFQLHIPEAEMILSHPKFVTQGQRALTAEQLKELKNHAEAEGLYFLCTPFSREAADQLESIGVEAFKIGSGEVSDLPFIEHVARKRKPMIVSTGMTDLDEIGAAVEVVQRHHAPLMLMHCISIYPPSYERMNLGVIPILRDRFGVPVGLSDHTPEIYSAIAAVPFGAALIEKHYTLDRNQPGTSDHKISLEPHEWKMLVDGVRKIEKAGGSDKRVFEEERTTIEWARHGVVSVKDIQRGAVISAEMVSTKRPLWDGIPANQLPNVIGKKAKNDIPAHNLIHWDDIEK